MAPGDGDARRTELPVGTGLAKFFLAISEGSSFRNEVLLSSLSLLKGTEGSLIAQEAVVTTRELGLVKQTVEEATGLEISHFYDDLVFVDLGVFLLRFDNVVPGKIHLHFQKDCEADARRELTLKLTDRSQANKLTLVPAPDFILESVEGREEIQIRFNP